MEGPCYPASDHQGRLVNITNGSRYAGLPPAGEAAWGWVLSVPRRPLLGWSSGATERRWPCYAASSRQGCLVIITIGSRYPGLRPGLTRRPELMPLGASLVISMGPMAKGGHSPARPGWFLVHQESAYRLQSIQTYSVVMGSSTSFASVSIAHCDALKVPGKSLFE
jgi:hypothetical protein